MTHAPVCSDSSLSSAIVVDSSVSAVKCNGGNGALGHPEVYYTFGKAPDVTCDYCGQRFVKSPLS